MTGKTRVKLNQATTETAGTQRGQINNANQRTEILEKLNVDDCIMI
jgi:hypothetical protein